MKDDEHKFKKFRRNSKSLLQSAACIYKTLRVDLEFFADAGGDPERGNDGPSDVFADT